MNTRQQYDRVIARTYAPPPVVFARGEGSVLWDEDGRDYIDFGGGIAVASLGHCAPALTEAIARQAQTLMHVSNLHVTAPAVQAAALLTDNTFAERVFWCNSGAEANEAALKLARRRGEARRNSKFKVLSFTGGFHGRVGLAMAATPQPKVRDGFGELAPGFESVPFNDLDAAAAALDDDFCAVIVEPVQGEGGVNIASAAFLRVLRQLCARHDALLIFDEVQSGAGRTGELFAYMHCDEGGGAIIPDVLTAAKGLGGGFPVAAMLMTEDAAAALDAGSHGTTFGGNPLACAAAAAVLRELLADGFLAGARERAEEFAQRLRAINDQLGCFADIRMSGLLIGCDMADGLSAKDAAAACLREGLVALTAGDNALRLAPALNIPADAIAKGVARLQKALTGLRR